MKPKQVLSVEQMKRLQELGLDTRDASFYVWKEAHADTVISNGNAPEMNNAYPVYTLQDILDKLPESIQIYDLYIFKQASLWVFKYIDVEDETLHSETMPGIMDAAYYMLCWCIEKGYIKTNQL